MHVLKTAFMFIVLAAFYNGPASSQNIRYENAPKVVPRTTEAMQHPDFWIANIKGNPDRVIMTPGDIAKMNRRNRSLPKVIKDINGDAYSIENVLKSKESLGLQFNVEDPLSIKSFPGDSLRTRLKIHWNYFEPRTWYDRRKMKYEDDVKNELYEMTDPESIPDVITPRYGILVRHTLNRVVPSNQAGYGGRGGWTDGLQSTSLDVAMPVAILHSSKDNDWYYVRSEIAFGWIPAENVALGSAKELKEYINSKDFISALEYNVPVYGDRKFEAFIINLFIGSRIKLLEKNSNGYHVLVPVRKADGSFEAVEGWVKPDAKVSAGYQPFTQRNIINTMFNMLYRPYGWADSHHEYDCCGLVRVVLRTFGIFTGRWTSFELHATDHVYAFPRNTDKKIKYQYLEKCEPGICFVGNAGHICMYLGEVDGRHYVIHQGGYTYKAEDGTVMEYNRVNVNDTELDGGSNIRTWTEISTFKP